MIKVINHPGELIREEIEARDWTCEGVAWLMGWKPEALGSLLDGNMEIDPSVSALLGSVFNVSPQFFLNLQRLHNEARNTEESSDA